MARILHGTQKVFLISRKSRTQNETKDALRLSVSIKSAKKSVLSYSGSRCMGICNRLKAQLILNLVAGITG